MTITVNHPVLGAVTFPDTATPEQINQTLLQIGAETLPEKSSGEVFFNQMGEGLQSSFEGLAQMTGLPTEYITSPEEEFRNRVELEQSPYAGYGGYIVGSILDPVTLPAAFFKPIQVGGAVATGVARGSIAGAAGGVVEPVYEEFGDSRLLNTTVGGVFGGALGGVIGRLTRKSTKTDVEDAVEEQLDNVADAVETPQIRVDETPTTPATIRVDTPDPIQTLRAELEPRAKLAMSSGEAKKAQKTIDALQKRVDNMEKVKPKRGSQVAKNLAKAQADLKTARERYTQGVDPVNRQARTDLNRIEAGKQKDVSVESTARLEELGTPQLVQKTPLARAVEGEDLGPVVRQPEGGQPILFVRPTMPLKSPTTPMTRTLEGLNEETVQTIQRRVKGEPDPEVTPPAPITMDELLNRTMQGGGAARTSALDLTSDIKLGSFESVLARSGKIQPRTVTYYQPPDGATGTGKWRTRPAATPENAIPSGPARELAAKMYQALNVLKAGANEARGRTATRGSGSQKARIGAAKRFQKELDEAGVQLEEFFLAVQRGDITATELLASAPLQRELMQRHREISRQLDELIDEFGSIDAIPNDIYRDMMRSYVPTLLVNRTLHGALTSAADLLNAQKWVKKALKADERMTDLFGQRCF